MAGVQGREFGCVREDKEWEWVRACVFYTVTGGQVRSVQRENNKERLAGWNELAG